ncbi:MAG: hypothetical protein HFJ95_04430 [Muribaculaceae bacterium]|nr:hypothetical protein [Muribaculaceae bacterium]
MTKKLIIIIVSVAALAAMMNCGSGSTKGKINNAMREYVTPALADCERYGFIGLSNHRDTIYMGVTRPCVGVIYTVENRYTGEKKRHYADVIFSNDFNTVLNATESGFDPIEYAEDKIREALREALKKRL